MSDPLVPNFKPGIGRLSTDRYDFQKHVDGQSFKHNANQIDLSPSLTIDGNLTTTVQDAVLNLLNIVEPPNTILATASVPGSIQLSTSGDLQGTAINLKVTGIRGYQINTSVPTINNVLTWNGSSWGPEPAQNSFTAGGDLTGSGISQQVVNLTGNTSTHPGFRTIQSAADYIEFYNTNQPIITQASTGISDGYNLKILAQRSTAGGGGNVIISGADGSVKKGGVGLSIGPVGSISDDGYFMIEAVEAIAGQRVAAFFTNSGLSSSNMPVNTGNGVMFIHDTYSVPTASPVTGSILYSNGGTLNIKQADGLAFTIGSITNPSPWQSPAINVLPPTGTIPTSGKITYNSYVSSTTSTNTTAFTFPMPASTVIRLNITLVGKEVATGNSAHYNYIIGYIRNGTNAPLVVGTLTSFDPRIVGSWVDPPSPSISTNNIVITTGHSSAAIARWTVITEIVITAA